MKKTIIATGLLAIFGSVHAESSVTLYGNLNVSYQKKGDEQVVMKAQEYRYASHIGVNGKEDLGSGYSAIFKMEAEIEPDTGTGTYGSDKKQFGFNRHSYVGLVTPFGAFRFGRSTTPFTNMWVGGGYADGRGIGEFTGGLAGTGLRTTNPEIAARWNNAFFYDVKKNGFSAGLAVTTKGSQSSVPTRTEPLKASKNLTTSTGVVVVPEGTVISPQTMPVNNEGASGTKPAYGAYLGYKGQAGKLGYKVGAAYQVDNGSSYSSFGPYSNSTNAPAEAKNAWILAGGLSYGSAKFDIGYAQSKIDNTGLLSTPTTTATSTNIAIQTAKSKTLFASLGFDVTANDRIYASYGRYKRSNEYKYASTLNGHGEIAGSQYSFGYEHRMSKRTVVYANVRKVANITNSCSATTITGISLTEASPTYVKTCGVSRETVDSVLAKEKDYSYDIGISHSF